MLPIELAWPVAANTGWGLFGLHLALGLARQGRRVHIPAAEPPGIPATLVPTIRAMMQLGNHHERRIRFDTWGNHAPEFHEIPNRFRVLLAVFEDTAAVRPDVMNRYDLVLAPSRWVQELLAAHGVDSTLWHQGLNASLFNFQPRLRPRDGPLYVFIGGKLEFRKGTDIAIEAFRRFQGTPEGKDAVLVSAIQNLWPQTMEGIWTSGYVKGIPVQRGNALDISSWLEANGIPRHSHIDLGLATQEEFSAAIKECDVALFPNRCEGATNMVAAECIASGVQSIVSQNTGQLDLTGIIPLDHQTPVTAPCDLYRGMNGWGESDPEECVDRLRAVARRDTVVPDENMLNFALLWSWTERTSVLNYILGRTADVI